MVVKPVQLKPKIPPKSQLQSTRGETKK